MCSVAGGQNRVAVEQMLDTMKHRAPDGNNVLPCGNFFIGMGRLAIIDLKSEGLFPYREDHLTLTFNGEIYNYIELRKELEDLGHKFRTQSDTEVLLKSYKEWGYKCLDKFNGMFAFAIHDGKKESLFLARDIAGEKPLYYHHDENVFSFASEAKALHWKCQEFPPSYCATFDFKTGALTMMRYWDIPKTPTFAYDYDDHYETHLEMLLEDAVKIRTRSDVPYALYFSGGIDSSLISTYHTFEHQFTYYNKYYQKEFLKVFPKILWHLDYPIKSFSAFGLWKLAEEASKSVRVVISGEGADELFGGYIRYVPDALFHQASLKFPSYKTMFPHLKTASDWGRQEFYGNMQELLRMGDRMASAWGVENRCPFLDRRVIEFAFNLPNHLKIWDFDTKTILRRILKRRLPDYKDIEKAGLYCDVNKWLGEEDKFSKEKYLRYQNKLYESVRHSSL